VGLTIDPCNISLFVDSSTVENILVTPEYYLLVGWDKGILTVLYQRNKFLCHGEGVVLGSSYDWLALSLKLYAIS
jgi:hypothetical protein